MSKKLKIQFWKTRRSLSMAILSQEGLPRLKETGHIRIKAGPYLDLGLVYLRGNYWGSDFQVVSRTFNCDLERDLYLERAVNDITHELFTSNKDTELRVGKCCRATNFENGVCVIGKLLTILPKQYQSRFIVEDVDDNTLHNAYRYAYPVTKIFEPKLEVCGNVITYTWEEK